MDELIRQVGQYPGSSVNVVSMGHVLLAVVLSFLLSMLIAYVYRETHCGTSYSQSYVHTLVIMSVCTAVIMVIIGSNIARAFSLVGALSIIRFRSAIKETRDVAFIFIVMAIGMACGTRFYDIAILFAILVSSIVFFLSKFDIGAKPFSECLLKITVSREVDYAEVFQKMFFMYFKSYALLSAESVPGDNSDLVYSVAVKKRVHPQVVLDAVSELSGVKKATFVTGLQNVNI